MIDQFHPIFNHLHEKAVQKPLRSAWVNEGPVTRKFEKRFARFAGTQYATATTSGSVALMLALKAIEDPNRRQVSIPDYTFGACVNAAKWLGIPYKLADVDERGIMSPSFPTSDYQSMVVSMNGRFPSNGWLGSGCIEDRSQALGEETLKGFCAVYSLASTKHLTTGQGGIITTNDKALWEKLLRLKDHGRWRLLDGSEGDWFPESMGLNFKFNDILASIGLVELATWPAKKKRLLAIYSMYRDLLRTEWFLDRKQNEVPWYIDIYVKDPKILQTLLLKKGIKSRRHYRPLHEQPNFRAEASLFPNASWFSQHGLYLPSSLDLTLNQIIRICKVIKAAKPELPN